MKAEAQPLTFLGQEGSIKIPYFQRDYVWDEDNWDSMIAELRDYDGSHFLGSLILKQITKQSGKPGYALVIDGQQRLTTLSILLRALFDSFPADQENRALKGNFYNCLFYSDEKGKECVKIDHSRRDKEGYQRVIKGEITADEINLKTERRKILRCYKHLSVVLKSIGPEECKRMFRDLLDPQKPLFVVIDLQGGENEQAIFDTINNAGVRLSCADTIKNAMFQRLLELDVASGIVEEQYENNWEKVFLADESIEFWRTVRTMGRAKRDNLEILLHSFAIINKFFDPDKHKLTNLAEEYKTYIEGLQKDSLIDMIELFKEYADLYREKFLVFEKETPFKYIDDDGKVEVEKRLFHVLDTCDVSTFYPYILHLYREYKDNVPELEKALKKLEVFVVRRAICRAETKNYNKLCREFIDKLSKIDDLLSETPDIKVEESLTQIGSRGSNKLATLLLFWVKLHRHRSNNTLRDKDVGTLKYSYTLEHIMPQSWEEHWKTVPISSEDESLMDVTSVVGKEYREKTIQSIGNMTLLTRPLNSTLQNLSFREKIEGKGSKKGIRECSELFITTWDIVKPYEEGDMVWDEVKIRNRASKIAAEVLKIWSV